MAKNDAPQDTPPPAVEATPPPEAAPPAEAAAEAAPPAAEPAATEPPAAEPPMNEPDTYDATAQFAAQVAELEARNAEIQRRLAEAEERATREEAARQDLDLTSRRDALRAQILSALESGDEKARTQLTWQLNDVEGELAERRNNRRIASLQPQQPKAPTIDQRELQVAVWKSFAATNRITPEEHQKMFASVQARMSRGEKVQEGPVLYAQLLREVRRKQTPAAKVPLVEATGAMAASTPSAAQMKHPKSEYEKWASKLFAGAITADELANMNNRGSR